MISFSLESAKSMLDGFIDRLPTTAQLRLFGITKIPLLFLVGPKVTQLDDEGCSIRVPLNYITRNHVGSMYFGTLAIGADTVVAVLALKYAKGHKVTPIFKNLHVDFLKRAEDDVLFRCSAAKQIESIVKKAIATKVRVTEDVAVEAVLEKDPTIVVAKFTLGLSVKASQ